MFKGHANDLNYDRNFLKKSHTEGFPKSGHQYIIINVTLYCSSIFFTQVENPSQQPDASIDTIYSLVVSVESSPPIHEIYIDAHFRNTALKVKQYTWLNLILTLS